MKDEFSLSKCRMEILPIYAIQKDQGLFQPFQKNKAGTEG